MLPMLFRGGGEQAPRETSESDYWYVTSGIQETYDTIVKEAEGWREAASRKKRGMFSSLSRRKRVVFVADQASSPRLYRVRDDDVGEISFELTEAEDGGTSVKSTYSSNARALVQALRAKMPARVPSSGPKVCPTCGKEMMPDFKACPYCGTKIR